MTDPGRPGCETEEVSGTHSRNRSAPPPQRRGPDATDRLSPPPYRDPSHRAWPWIAYGVPVALVLGTVSIWFHAGGFLASGDVGPLVRDSLLHELGLPWNHQDSGAGSASYATTVRMLEAACVVAARTLGLSDVAGQWLLYTGILGGAAAAVSGLCAVWLRNAWAVAFGGTVAVVNVFTLVNLLNPLPGLALLETALLGGLVLRASRGVRRRGRVRTAVVLALGTLPLSYLGLNPPLLAVVAIGVLALLAFSGPLTGGSTGAAVRVVALAAPIALLVNAWWLLPETLALHGGGGVTFAAQTDVEAWTWTMQRSSLTNVLSLNAQWGWAFTDYAPFAPRMDELPWSVIRWSLPLLALTGCCAPPGDRTTRRALRALGLSAAPIAFLSKGLHTPLVGVNLLIYREVPGMWLFREPMSKFGDLLVLVYALLAAAAIERALRRGLPPGIARRPISAAAMPKATAAVLALSLGSLCYPWPLWTSAVVAESRGVLPTAQVHVPKGWLRVADAIDRVSDHGKVLELPLDTYYQITTTWGYHGVDNVPQQFIRRPVLQQLPDGYFGATAQLAAALQATQRTLVEGDARAARNLLDALGANTVLIRRDLRRLPGDLPQPDPSKLAAALARVPGMRLMESSPLAYVFALVPGDPAKSTGDLSVATALQGAYGIDADQFAADLESQAAGSALTGDPMTPVDSASAVLSGPGAEVIDLAGTGWYRLARASEGEAFLPAVRRTRHRRYLELSDAYQITAAGRPLPGPAPIRIPIKPPTAPGSPASGLDSVSRWALDVQAATTRSAAAVQTNAPQPLRLQPGVPVKLSPGDRMTAYEVIGGDNPSYLQAGTTVVPNAANASRTAFLSAGPALVTLTSSQSQTGLTFGSRVEDCNKSDGRTLAMSAITERQTPDGTATLTAAAHTACIIAPFASGAIGSAYNVSFDYRTAAGYPARYCVWEDGPERCATAPALTASTSWQRLTTVIHPDPGTTRLRLYLYADGQPNPVTSVQYRAIRAERAMPAIVAVQPLRPTSPDPAVATWRENHTGSYDLTLTGVRSRTVITLGESFDPRWQISGLPAAWSSRHVRVNGYANAWIIEGHGNARLGIEFEPERSVNHAQWLSAVVLAACLIILVHARFRPSGGLRSGRVRSW